MPLRAPLRSAMWREAAQRCATSERFSLRLRSVALTLPDMNLDDAALLSDASGQPVATHGPITMIESLSREERYALAVIANSRMNQGVAVPQRVIAITLHELKAANGLTSHERELRFNRGYAGLVARSVIEDHGRDAAGARIMTFFANRLAYREGLVS